MKCGGYTNDLGLCLFLVAPLCSFCVALNEHIHKITATVSAIKGCSACDSYILAFHLKYFNFFALSK